MAIRTCDPTRDPVTREWQKEQDTGRPPRASEIMNGQILTHVHPHKKAQKVIEDKKSARNYH